MAISNHERVGKALELLKIGLGPFVEREFKSTYKDRVAAEVTRLLGEDRLNAKKPIAKWDVAALLKLMWESWNDVFRKTLGPAERSLLSELRDHRNKWAHQESFSSDDAYRALDSAGRLLTAISAPQAADIETMKMELLRLRFDEQVRGEKRKSAGTAIESAATGRPSNRGGKCGDTPQRRGERTLPAGRICRRPLAGPSRRRDWTSTRTPLELSSAARISLESLKQMLVGAIRAPSRVKAVTRSYSSRQTLAAAKPIRCCRVYHLFSGIAPTGALGYRRGDAGECGDGQKIANRATRRAGWKQDFGLAIRQPSPMAQ